MIINNFNAGSVWATLGNEFRGGIIGYVFWTHDSIIKYNFSLRCEFKGNNLSLELFGGGIDYFWNGWHCCCLFSFNGVFNSGGTIGISPFAGIFGIWNIFYGMHLLDVLNEGVLIAQNYVWFSLFGWIWNPCFCESCPCCACESCLCCPCWCPPCDCICVCVSCGGTPFPVHANWWNPWGNNLAGTRNLEKYVLYLETLILYLQQLYLQNFLITEVKV